MRPHLKNSTRASSLAALLILATASPAAAQDSPSRGIALPDRSLSGQDDAASVEVNPAGLGFMQGAELRYAFELGAPNDARSNNDGHAVFTALGLGGFGLGFGAQWLLHPALGGDLEALPQIHPRGRLRPLRRLEPRPGREPLRQRPR